MNRMENKTEVKTFKINYVCDSCEDGYMDPIGVAIMSNPAKYPHKCRACGAEQTFRCLYPHTVQE